MNNIIRTLVCLLLVSICNAQNIVTLNGQVYSRATIIRVESNGVVVSHEKGISKIPFGELTNGISFTQEYSTNGNLKQIKTDDPRTNCWKILGEVISSLDGAILVSGKSISWTDFIYNRSLNCSINQQKHNAAILKKHISDTEGAIIEPYHGVAVGGLGGFIGGENSTEIKIKEKKNAQIRSDLAPYKSKLKNISDWISNAETKYKQPLEGVFCIYGVEKLADGDKWSGIVYGCGLYEYISSSGSKKTVRAYSVSQETAEKHNY